MSRSTRIAAVGAALLTTVTTGLWAAPAQAATTGVVSVVSTTKIRYKAGSGHQNRVVITRSGNTVTVDDRVAIKAGKGCKAVKGDKTRVRCTPAKAPTRIQVFAGDRSDRVENRTDLGMTANGENGNDVLIGGPRRDVLWGDNGNDKLYGNGGDDELAGHGDDDRIWGGEGGDRIVGSDGHDVIAAGGGWDFISAGAGNDWISGGAGNDHITMMDGREYGSDNDYISGGSGHDSVGYTAYRRPITADADGVKGDDGAKGEHDTIATDMEEIAGGAAGDRLYGTAGANVLYGYEGDDVIYGFGGDDMLNGEEGSDRLYGGAGNDDVHGYDRGRAGGKDLLDGGVGTDTCTPEGSDTQVACEI